MTEIPKNNENGPEIKAFIGDKCAPFWSIPETAKEDISHEVLVETILNYGKEKDVKRLFDLLGVQHVADIFYKHTNRKRVNYFKLVVNFFNLYFKRHAS